MLARDGEDIDRNENVRREKASSTGGLSTGFTFSCSVNPDPNLRREMHTMAATTRSSASSLALQMLNAAEALEVSIHHDS